MNKLITAASMSVSKINVDPTRARALISQLHQVQQRITAVAKERPVSVPAITKKQKNDQDNKPRLTHNSLFPLLEGTQTNLLWFFPQK